MKELLFLVLIGISSQLAGQSLVQPFELVNVADGKIMPVKNCSGCTGLVVIFTSLKCPYDQHYQDRIKALQEKYSGKISFFLINSILGSDDNETNMKTTLNSWGTNIPYLSDKKQIALNALGATRTPESFLLKPEGNGFKILYQGAIDDNPQVHNDTDKNFLDNAIGEFLSGKSITNSKERVIGCTIRKAG